MVSCLLSATQHMLHYIKIRIYRNTCEKAQIPGRQPTQTSLRRHQHNLHRGDAHVSGSGAHHHLWLPSGERRQHPGQAEVRAGPTGPPAQETAAQAEGTLGHVRGAPCPPGPPRSRRGRPADGRIR